MNIDILSNNIKPRSIVANHLSVELLFEKHKTQLSRTFLKEMRVQDKCFQQMHILFDIFQLV